MSSDTRPEAKIAELISAARGDIDGLPKYLAEHRLKSLSVVSEALLIAEQTLGSTSACSARLRTAHSSLVQSSAAGKEGVYKVQKPAPSSRKQSPHVSVNTGCLGDIEHVHVLFHQDYILIRKLPDEENTK